MEIMMEFMLKNGAYAVLFIGIMAFIVSCVTEALKHIRWLDKRVPTSVVVLVLSLVFCPVGFAGLAKYYHFALDWFMVFASFIAAFIVALVSMDGWDKVDELKSRFIRKLQE